MLAQAAHPVNRQEPMPIRLHTIRITAMSARKFHARPPAMSAVGEAMVLILYGTSECHLCEQAQEQVLAAAGRPAIEIDVAEDDGLYQRYGLRIPVLRRQDTGAELDWPFDTGAVIALLGA